MKIDQYTGGLTTFNPEFDRNFGFGIYEVNNAYNDARIIEFQDNTDMPIKVGGTLKDTNYFLVRGENMPGVENQIKNLVKKYNWEEQTSLQGLRDLISTKFPKVDIINSHKEDIERSYNKIRKNWPYIKSIIDRDTNLN